MDGPDDERRFQEPEAGAGGCSRCGRDAAGGASSLKSSLDGEGPRELILCESCGRSFRRWLQRSGSRDRDRKRFLPLISETKYQGKDHDQNHGEDKTHSQGGGRRRGRRRSLKSVDESEEARRSRNIVLSFLIICTLMGTMAFLIFNLGKIRLRN